MLTDKRLEKLSSDLGKSTLQELEAMDDSALALRVVQAGAAMKSAKSELDANPKFQQIKADKNALESGFKDVKKRQTGIVEYCLHLLEERGADLSVGGSEDEDESNDET